MKTIRHINRSIKSYWAGLTYYSRSFLSIWLMTTVTSALIGISTHTSAQPSARDLRGPAPVMPLASEPPAKLVVDPPLTEPLAKGRVVIQYRTENLRIVPVFGQAALEISPRVGHIHVTVDDLPWRWADTSNEPLIINGLPAGAHRILIELVDPTHKTIDQKTVSFIIAAHPQPGMSHHE